jgi:2'-5' RNA ligase
MRLFIGIELDEPVKRAAAAAAANLRSRLQRVEKGLVARWVPADNLHVTLWFIGEVTDGRALDIDGALRGGFDAPSFTLEVAGCGAFPESGPPRVFWLGVPTGGEDLSRLHAQTAALLLPLGIKGDRRTYYRSHVTIARVKTTPRGSTAVIRRTVANTAARCGSCRVAAVTLFRSRVSSAGSAYEPLVRVPLP